MGVGRRREGAKAERRGGGVEGGVGVKGQGKWGLRGGKGKEARESED